MIETLFTIILIPFAVGAVVVTGCIAYGVVKAIFGKK